MTTTELYRKLISIYGNTYIKLQPKDSFCEILETGEKATITQLKVENTDETIHIDPRQLNSTDKLLKAKMKSVYSTDNFNFQKICDGVAVNSNAGIVNIFYFEMKSILGIGALAKAIEQFESSNLKVKLMLNMFDFFNDSNTKIKCFIVCEFPDDINKLKIEISKAINKTDISENQKHLYESLYNLITKKKSSWNPKTTNCCNFGIKNEYKFNNVEISVILGNEKVFNL